MRRGRVFIYLALIIILGLVAAYVLLQRNSQAPEGTDLDMTVPEAQIVEEIEVVVITQNTPRGTILDETLLTTIQIPKNDAVDGMFFSDLAAVVNRRAKFDLDSGIPLTASMLVDSADALSATGSLAALQIPRGKVAVSIPISRLSGISYAPRPGDHVSIIATMMFVDLDSEFQTRLPNEFFPISGPIIDEEEGINLITIALGADTDTGVMEKTDTAYFFQGRTELDPLLNELVYVVSPEIQRPRMVSQMLLQDATVLQVGNFPLESEDETPPTYAGGDGTLTEPVPEPVPEDALVEQKPPDVITLIVSPQDAVTLNYMMYSGAGLTLALRASGDDSVAATESATLQFILDTYDITLPAKLPYGLEPRTDDIIPPVLENDLEPIQQ